MPGSAAPGRGPGLGLGGLCTARTDPWASLTCLRHLPRPRREACGAPGGSTAHLALWVHKSLFKGIFMGRFSVAPAESVSGGKGAEARARGCGRGGKQARPAARRPPLPA